MKRVDVVGGDVQFIAPLKRMQTDDPAKNWEVYSNWADSVRSFPKVTKQKVRGKSNKLFELNAGFTLYAI